MVIPVAVKDLHKPHASFNQSPRDNALLGDEIRLLGHRASDETHAALEGLEERAEHAGDYAAGKLEKLATAALGFASSIARKSGKRIEQAGEATSEGTHKLADFAEDLRKKVGH